MLSVRAPSTTPWPSTQMPQSAYRLEYGTFTADVTFGAGGIVTDYPGLGGLA
jgi:hypothetical protein